MACRVNLIKSLFYFLVLCQGILAIDLSQLCGSSDPNLLIPRQYTEEDLDKTNGYVSFHPEGATEGFKCHYPEFSSKHWEGCNDGVDKRWCWMRQTGGVEDGSARKGYTVTTNCKCCSFTLDSSSHFVSALC